MTRKKQNKIPIGDKILYKVKTPNGWSIIIMPDNILIDNYHVGKAHIHPFPQNHAYRVELSLQECEKIYEIIKDYLNVSNEFDIGELMEMLK
ncbi:hypothetical protein [Methanobrevibacter sp.]|uniref:hypothetical protein n=1 Tax=Methanobrevibacter sp. TaxID=66852 RepID=UPI00386B727A